MHSLLKKSIFSLYYVIGHRKKILGNVVLFGPQDFLKIAEEAFETIRGNDRNLYESITKEHFTICSNPDGKIAHRTSSWIFPNRCDLAWGSNGIVAVILFFYFDRIGGYSTACDQTASWLRTYSFPTPLVATYENP